MSNSAPLAFLHGEAVLEKPEDLYIPPDALKVILESFEGPLDLLLYLIKRHKLDILQLPIHSITKQYVSYVELMKDLQLELAGEYLVMAALLAQIKSRMLLPTHEELEEEADPRAELVKRLQEYEQFKTAAETLKEQPHVGKDFFIANAEYVDNALDEEKLPDLNLKDLVLAFGQVMTRVKTLAHHQISSEVLSTRERMSRILRHLSEHSGPCAFVTLFDFAEGRQGVVVTFIAMLELIKEQLVTFTQITPQSEIYLSLKLQE
ncbi:segregation and condensation protein A [Pseudoalteromonas sp. SS15]|uniref:segregation and condensation protein A n=1 Tax=Pseudoalteromonas sp. SS15 TaxID=3139393 RepID=UPI003BADA873